MKCSENIKCTNKVNLFHYRRSSRVNIYMLEDTIDYFYGYMASNTAYIRYFDLYLYDDGFVLQMPEPSAPEKWMPLNRLRNYSMF